MPRRQAGAVPFKTGVTSGKRSRRSLGECTTRAQICLDLGQRGSVLTVQQARGARFGQSVCGSTHGFLAAGHQAAAGA
jgi:hypothetical protein